MIISVSVDKKNAAVSKVYYASTASTLLLISIYKRPFSMDKEEKSILAYTLCGLGRRVYWAKGLARDQDRFQSGS